MASNDQWHLDKKVPISLIFAIALQTAGFVWVAATMSQNIDDNERRIQIVEERQQVTQNVVNNNTIGVAVINENLRGVKASLERIERALAELDKQP